MRHVPSWDEYFLGIAAAAAQRSKDPNTQVGAVIVRPDQTMASIGYNGFPRGVEDTSDRWTSEHKHDFVIHAESNAIHMAKEPLRGYTIYISIWPCSACARMIIQSGITEVVTSAAANKQRVCAMASRPDAVEKTRDHELAQSLLLEGGVLAREVTA